MYTEKPFYFIKISSILSLFRAIFASNVEYFKPVQKIRALKPFWNQVLVQIALEQRSYWVIFWPVRQIMA